MAELKLINGKFMRGQVEEKPEIGNIEQIRLLKYFEKLHDAYKEGLIIDPEYYGTTCRVNIKCVCGTPIQFETEFDEEDDLDPLIGMIKKCPNCKNKYIIDENEDYLLVVKFKT
jgi:hypothetical protein